MYRHSTSPRAGWQAIVESQGLAYHSLDDLPYWDESVYYEFTPREIDVLEQASSELSDLCLQAVDHVFRTDRLEQFQIPRTFHPFLRDSWEQDEHTIYGRFDLAFDGVMQPKLLEYNADTPTSLLEAAVIQWFWLQDAHPRCDQFNSIHDRLIEAWRDFEGRGERKLYFAAVAGQVEDYMTVNYLRDAAAQAGWETSYLDVEQIGWHEGRHAFTDLEEAEIELCFKLYPWEWMLREDFGPRLVESRCRWLEPPWKAILSNKAILPVLWELFPGHPNLLPASFEPLSGGNYVRKPIFSREGANIQLFQRGRMFLETEGPYDGPWIYQELHPLPRFQNRYSAVIGSWIVNGWACGIGLREDESPITGNTSRFVPHLVR